MVVPTLEKMQKEGEAGQRRITQYTRYLTVALAACSLPATWSCSTTAGPGRVERAARPHAASFILIVLSP